MSENAGISVAMFVTSLVAGVVAWLLMGSPPIICRQPALTKDNYVDQKLDAHDRQCLFILREHTKP